MSYLRIAGGKVVSITGGHYMQGLSGPDASKPTPGVGDVYYATDTAKVYVCYVNGIWALVSSKVVNGYQNHLGTVDNIMSTTLAGNGTASTDAANHELDMSSGDDGVSSSLYEGNLSITPQTDIFSYNVILKNIVNGTANKTYGYFGVIATGSLEGVKFEWGADEVWMCRTVDGFSAEETTITAPSSGDILTILGQKQKTHFLVNGTIVASHTSIIPTGNYKPLAYLSNVVAAAVARSVSVDFISFEVFQ